MRLVYRNVAWASLSVIVAAAGALPGTVLARTAYYTGVNGGGPPIITKVTGAGPVTADESEEPEEGAYAAPVDLATETPGTEVPLGNNQAPEALAITPDGTRVYVAHTRNDEVVPIDIATNIAETPIPVGNEPAAIAITPDGSYAYVANAGDDNVTPIDLATDTPEAPISVGGLPFDVAITPDGTRAFASNFLDDTVSEIDLVTATVEKTIPVGSYPTAVAITPDGTRAYVTNGGEHSVMQIDLASGLAGPPIGVTEYPEAIAITPNGTQAYVVGWGSPVSEIDLGTDTGGGEILFGGDFLFNIALLPDGSRAYVIDSDTEELAPFDVPANTHAAAFAVGEGPEAIAIVPNQGPSASLGASSTVADTGESIDFDASASGDSDGSVARYDWDFGDGNEAADGGAAPSHAYTAAGTYTVTLTVTDDEGCSTEFVFTGQTAYCNGSDAAQATLMVEVKEPQAPETPDDPVSPEDPRPAPREAGGSTPTAAPAGGVLGKRKRSRPCPRIAARATTFVPTIVPGPVVPGVRVRMASSRPVRLKVHATLIWSREGGRSHKANLGARRARINNWIRVRFPIPARLRSALPYRRKVRVRLRIRALPHRKSGRCGKVSHRALQVRVVKVFPHAVQRGR